MKKNKKKVGLSMVFKKKHTDEDFFAVISDVPCTTKCVIRSVGCSMTTALRYLTLLEKEGRLYYD